MEVMAPKASSNGGDDALGVINSYDARDGSFSSGVRWTDEAVFGQRAYFEPTSQPPALILDPARSHDEGLYMCRVDYRVSASTTSVVNLRVIIPPGYPVILWDSHEATTSIGPLRENERVTLTCRSIGGRPPPTLTWRSRGKEIPQVDSQTRLHPETGTYAVEATVTLTAKRVMVGRDLTCAAQISTIRDHADEDRGSNNLGIYVRPRTASISLNITLSPMEVRISGSESLVVTAGSEVKMRCRSFGSHPPANVTWWMDDTSLAPHVTSIVGDDGNTTASLKMKVKSEHDGGRLSCKAENPLLQDDPIRDVTQLIVYYPPKVTLSLGPLLNAEDIKEGGDVYFECHIKANPRFSSVEWYHNDARLTHNPTKGLAIIGLSLVLRDLQRTSSGSYACAATNLQGRTTSNAVYLTVRHTPICAGTTREKTQGATRGSAVTVKCTVEAEPTANLRWSWVKIREDANEEETLKGDMISSDLSSSVTFIPLTQDDYGRILCRATNAVGIQRSACVINLVPAGPPDAPFNCSATPMEVQSANDAGGEPEVILSVNCMEGFDGGLPQDFLLEAIQDGIVIANTSSEFPEWVVGALQKDAGVTLHISAHNARGSSDSVSLEVHTSTAQQRAATGQEEDEEDLVPLLGALIGGLSVLALLIVVAIVMAKRENPRESGKPMTEVTFTPVSTEGFDPDVVPSVPRIPRNLDVVPCSQGHQQHQNFYQQPADSYSEDSEWYGSSSAGKSNCGRACQDLACGSRPNEHGCSTSTRQETFNDHCSGPLEPQANGRVDPEGDENLNDAEPAIPDREQGLDTTFRSDRNYRLLSTQDSQFYPSAYLSQSSEQVSFGPPSTMRSRKPHLHDLYSNKRFSPEKDILLSRSVTCRRCLSLPRPKNIGVKCHQNSLRELRSAATIGRQQNMSSSTSLGHLDTLPSPSTKDDEPNSLSSKNKAEFHLGQGRDRISAASLSYQGSYNSLPRSKWHKQGSAVDINIAIPEEKGSIMIMKIAGKDLHKSGMKIEPQKQKYLLRRTLSEVECKSHFNTSQSIDPEAMEGQNNKNLQDIRSPHEAGDCYSVSRDNVLGNDGSLVTETKSAATYPNDEIQQYASERNLHAYRSKPQEVTGKKRPVPQQQGKLAQTIVYQKNDGTTLQTSATRYKSVPQESRV